MASWKGTFVRSKPNGPLSVVLTKVIKYDYISTLPDDILGYISSFLNIITVDSAIRILNRRWKLAVSKGFKFRELENLLVPNNTSDKKLFNIAERYPKWRYVDFSRCDLNSTLTTNGLISFFQKCTSIQCINITLSELSYDVLAILAKYSKSLYKLHLSYDHYSMITRKNIIYVCKQCPLLKHLVIHSCCSDKSCYCNNIFINNELPDVNIEKIKINNNIGLDDFYLFGILPNVNIHYY